MLELLYCEACGEVFLGGYRRHGTGFEWHLSPDHPDLESWPDLVSLQRDYARYVPTDRLAHPAPTPLVQQAVDGAIRILGSRRKLASKNATGVPSIPAYLRDYYGFLATQAGEPYRLNCEELTGQTDKDEARRQALLDFVRNDLVPRIDAIAPIDFNASYWQALAASVSRGYFTSQPQWQSLALAGVPAGRRGNLVQIITHPLGIRDTANPANGCVELTNAHAAATNAGATRIELRSFFDVRRRPYA